MQIEAVDVEKLLLAALLGAIIGLDREYRLKPAGFRTLLLVSMGAALFTIVSYKMALQDPLENSDVTRIASNIITGIGFIGAGIIFRNGLDIQGLTTSATVWVTAAIGMAAGIGNFGLAVTATAITWAALFVLHYIESMMEDVRMTEKYRVGWKSEHGVIDVKEFVEARSYRVKQVKLSKAEDMVIAEWTLRTSKETHNVLLHRMMTDPRIVLCEH